MEFCPNTKVHCLCLVAKASEHGLQGAFNIETEALRLSGACETTTRCIPNKGECSKGAFLQTDDFKRDIKTKEHFFYKTMILRET